MSIPQQKDTDLSDPKQRFVWAFQGIQFKGSPMAFPQPILEACITQEGLTVIRSSKRFSINLLFEVKIIL